MDKNRIRNTTNTRGNNNHPQTHKKILSRSNKNLTKPQEQDKKNDHHRSPIRKRTHAPKLGTIPPPRPDPRSILRRHPLHPHTRHRPRPTKTRTRPHPHRHTKRTPPPIHHPQNRQTQRRTLQQIHRSNHHRPTNTLREHARTTPTTKRKHALMDKNHSLRRPPKNSNMAPTHRHRMGKPQSRSQKNRHRIHPPRRMGRRLHHMRLLPRIPKPPRSARVRNSARRQSCIPRRSRK